MLEFGVMCFLILAGVGVMSWGLAQLDYKINKGKS